MKLHNVLITSILISFAICTLAFATDNCITITPKQDGPVSTASLIGPHPIVFEIGTLGIPWRQVMDVRTRNGKLEWQAKKDRVYEVWNAEDYAQAQIEYVRKELNHKNTSVRKPLPTLISTLSWIQKERRKHDSEKLQLSEMRLSSALSAVLGVCIDIDAGVGLKAWPESHLPVSSSFTCTVNGVKARLSSIMMPDNWKELTSTACKWFSASPKQIRSISQVQISNQAAYYYGTYPVIAWYEVKYGGVVFKVWNAANVELIPPFTKEASIHTVSDTEIDYVINLTSLLPIHNISDELSLPNGWTGNVPQKRFDLNKSRTLTYRINKPASDPAGLRIIGAIFRFEDYATSKRILTDHSLTLGRSTSVAGFKMVQPAGEEAPIVTVSDRAGRQMPDAGVMYFDASENFLPGESTYITIECASSSSSVLSIMYRTVNGKTVSTSPQTVEHSNGMQRLNFLMENAVFDGSFPGGADFSIRSNNSLIVFRINISRFRISTPNTTM